MTYKLSNLTLADITGIGIDWSDLYQDNVTEWDIRSWCLWPGLSVRQEYACPDMIIGVSRM